MICKLTNVDFQDILMVVNDASIVYNGKIPADRWKIPYMSAQELKEEIQRGVQFYGLKEKGTLIAVMGMQWVNDVTLIRHAYVLTSHQRIGLGEKLLNHSTQFSSNVKDLCWNLGSGRLGNKVL